MDIHFSDEELEQDIDDLLVECTTDIMFSVYGYKLMLDGRIYALRKRWVHDLSSYIMLRNDGIENVTKEMVRNHCFNIGGFNFGKDGVLYDCWIYPPSEKENRPCPPELIHKIKKILKVCNTDPFYTRINDESMHRWFLWLEYTKKSLTEYHGYFGEFNLVEPDEEW